MTTRATFQSNPSEVGWLESRPPQRRSENLSKPRECSPQRHQAKAKGTRNPIKPWGSQRPGSLEFQLGWMDVHFTRSVVQNRLFDFWVATKPFREFGASRKRGAPLVSLMWSMFSQGSSGWSPFHFFDFQVRKGLSIRPPELFNHAHSFPLAGPKTGRPENAATLWPPNSASVASTSPRGFSNEGHRGGHCHRGGHQDRAARTPGRNAGRAWVAREGLSDAHRKVHQGKNQPTPSKKNTNRGFYFWVLNRVGWLAGWLAGWLVGGLAGWQVGWLVGWLAGWLVVGRPFFV